MSSPQISWQPVKGGSFSSSVLHPVGGVVVTVVVAVVDVVLACPLIDEGNTTQIAKSRQMSTLKWPMSNRLRLCKNNLVKWSYSRQEGKESTDEVLYNCLFYRRLLFILTFLYSNYVVRCSYWVGLAKKIRELFSKGARQPEWDFCILRQWAFSLKFRAYRL